MATTTMLNKKDSVFQELGYSSIYRCFNELMETLIVNEALSENVCCKKDKVKFVLKNNKEIIFYPYYKKDRREQYMYRFDIYVVKNKVSNLLYTYFVEKENNHNEVLKTLRYEMVEGISEKVNSLSEALNSVYRVCCHEDAQRPRLKRLGSHKQYRCFWQDYISEDEYFTGENIENFMCVSYSAPEVWLFKKVVITTTLKDGERVSAKAEIHYPDGNIKCLLEGTDFDFFDAKNIKEIVHFELQENEGMDTSKCTRLY